MVSLGLRPEEPYLHAETPWLCTCLKCGNRIRVSYNNSVHRDRGCPYCHETKHNLGTPAQVYLIGNYGLGAGKIGVTHGGFRSGAFSRRGWKVVNTVELARRIDCYRIEKDFIHWLHTEGAFPFLSQSQMAGLDGYTETFSTEMINLDQADRKLRSLLNNLGLPCPS
jgi:hypothetical protein